MGFHAWDPRRQPVGEWLSGRLQETYPLFTGTTGAANAWAGTTGPADTGAGVTVAAAGSALAGLGVPRTALFSLVAALLLYGGFAAPSPRKDG